jgi:hypothetical protein
MDSLLERPEADATAGELKPLAQAVDRHQVVVGVGEVPRSRDRRPAYREIGVSRDHALSFP